MTGAAGPRPDDVDLPVIILVGPTAVGKTELAVELASELGGEIIGADSRQVYRRMDIGTAKPTAREQGAAVHHGIDVADPDEDFDGGAFCDLAVAAIGSIRARGRWPMVAGGSGFYVNSLLRGLPDLPPVDPLRRAALAQRLEQEGGVALHAALARVDPVSAARLHPNDGLRVMRALEVHGMTGRPVGELPRRSRIVGRVLELGIDRPREELQARIAQRVRLMWEMGLPEEVAGLLEAGYAADLKSMNALGYRETVEHLEGRADVDETIERIIVRTRQFVRKQRSWFRPPAGQAALHPEQDRAEIHRRVRGFLGATEPVAAAPDGH